MDDAIAPSNRTEPRPEPAWDVARLFPDQGSWSEEEYFALGDNHLVEYADGWIEVLPMPKASHQWIVAHLYAALLAFAGPSGLGVPLFAPYPVRLWPGKFREPDLAFLLTEHADRARPDYWDGADLLMEVLSDENRAHDLETKRREYAQAGIPEYWLVDPRDGRITVLRLEGASYAVHGSFDRGTRAASALLPGFTVEVAAALAPRP